MATQSISNKRKASQEQNMKRPACLNCDPGKVGFPIMRRAVSPAHWECPVCGRKYDRALKELENTDPDPELHAGDNPGQYI